jgi:hypothetical protein
MQTTPPIEQWELRADIMLMLEEYFKELEWNDMINVIFGYEEFEDDGINKAINEYNETMRKALKQLGRLATRLEYIKGE